jgi:predicted nucleic acid-binding protein
MRLVSDSGPILSFARAHRLDVLHAVVEGLYVPEAVYDDIVIAGRGKPGAAEVAQSDWIKRTPLNDLSSADRFSSRLHAGERQAISLAKELRLTLLVDEREARRTARSLGIPFLGSLRILHEAKRAGVIAEIRPLVQELLDSGIYLGDSMLRNFFREVGEP